MKILRWIIFIPASVIAGAIIGGLANYTAQLWTFGIIAAILGGIFSALAIFHFGLKIAPNDSNNVKLTLVIVIILMGMLSLMGSLMNNMGDNQTIQAIVMIIMALGLILNLKSV